MPFNQNGIAPNTIEGNYVHNYVLRGSNTMGGGKGMGKALHHGFDISLLPNTTNIGYVSYRSVREITWINNCDLILP